MERFIPHICTCRCNKSARERLLHAPGGRPPPHGERAGATEAGREATYNKRSQDGRP
jgi:hypothetical protein